MTSSDPSRKTAGRALGLLGADLPAAQLRTVGSRILKQSAGRSPALVILLVVVTLISVASTMLVPSALGTALDAARGQDDLGTALVWLATVFVVTLVATALIDLIGSYWGSHVTAWLRHRLLRHAFTLGLPGQRRFPSGEVLARLTENASNPASFVPLLTSAIATLLTSVGAVVALLVIHPRLGITFLVGVVPAVLLLRRFVTQASEPFLRYQQLLAAIITRLMDAHRGIRTIRASGTVKQDLDRILQPLPELHAIGRETWAVQRQAGWQLSLLGPLLQVLVLAVGGFLLSAGDITAGQLVAAASYVTLALGSIGLFDTLVALLTTQVGAGRVGEVLETSPSVAPPRRAQTVPSGTGRIELRGVTVRIEQRTVLDHLDLSVPAGTSVALVGGSGAGKTTLTSLIGRLIDPDEGEVLLDGVPVTHLDLAELRRTVTYAFERPALLGRTVHDLIAYGCPEASRDEVVAAATAAQADRFVRSLPEGYDTPVSQAPMSGGELQRLGLAQAVLADARVIVLDDATSSLDLATEVKVAQGLERLLVGRTSVVVAHRAATAGRADLVAWLDAGRIRALAPHHVLWSDPDYRAVFGADTPVPDGDGRGSPGVAGATP